jgi:hypothetical protein
MNNNIKEALDHILDNDLDGMRAAFSNALTNKAVERLDEKKIEIASNYFGLNK